MKLDKKKLQNTTTVYPDGKRLFLTAKHLLPNKVIDNLPQVSEAHMNQDNGLFVALVSIVSYLEGRQDNSTNGKAHVQACLNFLQSEPMTALHNNTYGMYYENNSRAYSFYWLSNFNNLKKIQKLEDEEKHGKF